MTFQSSSSLQSSSVCSSLSSLQTTSISTEASVPTTSTAVSPSPSVCPSSTAHGTPCGVALFDSEGASCAYDLSCGVSYVGLVVITTIADSSQSCALATAEYLEAAYGPRNIANSYFNFDAASGLCQVLVIDSLTHCRPYSVATSANSTIVASIADWSGCHV